MKALAYLNHGRFVVDCPAPGCADARLAHDDAGRRLAEDVCANGHPFQVVMPPAQLEAQILAAVADRPDVGDRAWYPQGHVRAQLAGLPTGQTVAELVRENDDVARFRAAQAQARRDHLAQLLADHGVEVDDDGNFKGTI